ncbi:MAG: LpqB family beta-propeller domain-containing protein [Bacteroidota bacterium]
MRALALWGTLALAPCAAPAQEEFTHPELEWRSIETKHFFVHYHTGAERTARVVARAAEDVYGPVTSLYGHEPDGKVSFIIRDYDDISNGAAYFYDNKIEIYAPSMDFDLRGTHNWLRNVVTHEFTHIVQIQTSMKFGRTVPALYLQWLNYEPEQRPDVLYGFPNVIASYPLSGFVVPVWFAEGVAQYNRAELRYDFWDSHRDMILRSYALDSTMLTWHQMSVFGKNSLGNESAYNAGFAFVRWLARTYGEKKLVEISRNLSRLTATGIDGAMEAALGRSAGEVYEEWSTSTRRAYLEAASGVRTLPLEGEPIPLAAEGEEDATDPGNREIQPLPAHPHGLSAAQHACCRFSTGFANLYPAFSPDGGKIAYVSTKGADYFSMSSLYVYDTATRKEKRVQGGVRTSVSWSPDGTKLFYGRTSRENPHWSLQFDLYAYDLVREEELRITHGKRALSPAVSPDGSRIVFVTGWDGTSNLALINADGSGYRTLTSYAEGEQVYTPRWSPSGDRIVFDYSVRDGRDIAEIRPDGTGLRFLVSGPDDSRSGVVTSDGARMVFSSDRTGIFNLYEMDLEGGSVRQLTNVLGGAFQPTVSPEGAIVFAFYTPTGYTIRRLARPEPLPPGDHHYRPPQEDRPPEGSPVLASAGGEEFDWESLRSYDDTRLTQGAGAGPFYRPRFGGLTVVPFLRFDNYGIAEHTLEAFKPGVYLFSSDVLEKTGFLASAALNSRLERDLFLQFNYRGKIPLLYQAGLEPTASAELYNVTRTTGNFITLGGNRIPVDVSYNLLEFDFVLSQPALSQFSSIEFRYAHSRYTSILEAFLLPERGVIVPGTSFLYLVANDLSLRFRIDAVVPSRTSEISPTGRRITLRIGRELNKFSPDGEYEQTSTGYVPKYERVNFTRVELQWREWIPFLFRNHTLGVRVKGGSILGPPVDDFFDFYAGGLLGMRGYPYYSLGGNEMLQAGLEYRFPLARNLDVRLLHVYFDKLYASFFTDVGHAWSGKMPPLRSFKTDAGAELRLETFSWYAYPTRIFLSAAYGMDGFERLVESRNQTVRYGKEWRFYLGILFGFDLE